jgi:hypothetical protein
MTEQRLPLIFALKHLHVAWRADNVGSPEEFSRTAQLMQGGHAIPAAGDAAVESLLGEGVLASLPQGAELQLLTMACEGWPTDAAYSFAGISAFGAKDVTRAKACAKHALTLNRDCTLARQLLRLIAAKSDVRCPFGADASRAPDVAAILAAET